jgi:hypothetical protein
MMTWVSVSLIRRTDSFVELELLGGCVYASDGYRCISSPIITCYSIGSCLLLMEMNEAGTDYMLIFLLSIHYVPIAEHDGKC